MSELRKRIRISKAAEMIGCSSKTIRRGLGNFELMKAGDKPNSPMVVWLHEVDRYIQKSRKTSY